jgi:hypothetical protein
MQGPCFSRYATIFIFLTTSFILLHSLVIPNKSIDINKNRMVLTKLFYYLLLFIIQMQPKYNQNPEKISEFDIHNKNSNVNQCDKRSNVNQCDIEQQEYQNRINPSKEVHFHHFYLLCILVFKQLQLGFSS